MNRTIPVLCSILFTVSAATSSAQVAWFSAKAADESPSYLGVYLQDVTAETVVDFNLKKEQGVICAEIISQSPAEEAGLQARDVITRWDGERVRSARQLQRLVRDTPVGRVVKAGVLRNGEAIQVKVTVGQRDLADQNQMPFQGLGQSQGQIPFGAWHPPIDLPDPFASLFPSQRPRLGVAMQPLTDQLADYFGLGDNDKGVLVVSVIEDSAAEAAGLLAGDVITHIGDEPVGSPEDVQIKVLHSQGTLDLTIMRDRNGRHLQVPLGDQDDPDEAEKSEAGDLKEEISYPRGTM